MNILGEFCQNEHTWGLLFQESEGAISVPMMGFILSQRMVGPAAAGYKAE